MSSAIPIYKDTAGLFYVEDNPPGAIDYKVYVEPKSQNQNVSFVDGFEIPDTENLDIDVDLNDFSDIAAEIDFDEIDIDFDMEDIASGVLDEIKTIGTDFLEDIGSEILSGIGGELVSGITSAFSAIPGVGSIISTGISVISSIFGGSNKQSYPSLEEIMADFTEKANEYIQKTVYPKVKDFFEKGAKCGFYGRIRKLYLGEITVETNIETVELEFTDFRYSENDVLNIAEFVKTIMYCAFSYGYEIGIHKADMTYLKEVHELIL